MISFRKAIRFCSLVLTLGVPFAASAGTFDVKTLIDTDNNRGTGCNVFTPGGIVSGIDVMITTSGTVTGSAGTVTAVTRQTCVNAVLNQFSSPVAVDGGWNVSVSPIGDIFVESHMGLDVLTMDNIGTPRFVFTSSSGLWYDVLVTPWSWGGGDIIMPHAARDRAVLPAPRNIVLDGLNPDWAGNVPLANGTASPPLWRFISAGAYAGLHDLFFNFLIHTNAAAPTAHDDNYSLSTLGGTLTVATLGVLNNDNPNNQPITASLVDTTQHGTLALAPNGGFTYIHDGSLASQDQFHYIAVGPSLSSNVATVTIDLPGTHPYTFTSVNNATFIDGQPNAFQVTVTGKPTPALSVTGDLPAGVTFQDNGNGTGVLSGTPGPNTSGDYALVFTAEKNTPHSTSQHFTLTVTCPGISVVSPAVTTGTAGTPFSQTFTQNGGTPPVNFTLNSGTLPPGLTLSSAGVLSGTPTGSGTFPITVKVTDVGGCTAVGPTYTLVISCHAVTVTNPATATGTANVAFSQTFTQSGAIGGATFSLNSGTLPAGLSLSGAGVLSGTPTQTGSFPITVKVTDGQGCVGIGSTYNLTIGCQTITVTNPATNSGTAAAAFSQTFTAGNTIGAVTFSTASTLPTGLTLSSAGVLSGTPTQTGTFPIVVKATDANGCFGNGATYNLTIACQTITVNNPATNTGTVNTAFSQTFTAPAAIGTKTFTLNSGTLPAGLTLSSAGVLSGTPTQTGSFPITVKATDSNGCFGVSATYTLTIGCQVITVNNPATNTGTVNVAFSQSFTTTNSIGAVTFTLNSGTLPTGVTLSSPGVLSGTPTQTGSFPITVHAVDANGCSANGATYTLTIGCQTITVNNPATSAGTVNVAFSQTFTSTNAIGAVTYSTSSTLPSGLTLSSGGVLSGTPTQSGSFPIVVHAVDANGCSGDGATYTLVIGCQIITVNNPATSTGTVNAAFSQTFTSSNTIGAVTYALNSGTLPAGLTLSSGGVLSGTPTQTGNFPITVKATDANGCSGTGATYTLIIGCQTITVNNPGTTTGTVNAAFSQSFTASNTVGTLTFTTASTLPAGLSLSTAGVLSGTPTQTGSFPIVVHVVDGNGCFANGSTYTLVIGCQTITVTNPATNTGTVSQPFTVTFTSGNTIGAVTYSTASTLPAGITLNGASGVLSGTPTQSGTFPIVVTATDANGCSGSGATYTLVIGCQTITVTNPASNSSAAGTPLPAANFTFTQSGGIGTTNFTTASTLPTGVTLSTAGVLQGTPTQGGSFPITVTATDSNGCTGVSSGYTLTITCPVITVTNPGVSSGTSGVAFSQTFTQAGGQGTITWSETGPLPAGITLNSATGVLSGTTNAAGSFPITVTATDQNGCTGTGPTYTLVINCQTITVTNPGVNTGTVDAPFSQTFTKTGILGTVTWSETGALPAGITLNPATGVLSGTPTVKGSFPITVTATDTNGCSGSSPYTLTINCQTITVTNPGVTTGTVDAPFSQSFSQSGAHGTATFTTASTLPAGLSLSTAGVLSGTPTVKGTFPIVVTVTDSNSCTGTGATYNLTINCQTITVTNPGVTTGTAGTAFSQNFSQSGAHGTATFTTASTLPTGFTLSTAGVLSGTTTQHGTFPIVVTVTDSNSCTGTSATYNLNIACNAITVTNPATTTGTVASPFSQTFTSSGTLGTPSYTTASTLPTGLTLHSATGILDGTPTQSGSFPIVVTATDSNGCTGTGATYTLVIGCNVITVTNPGVNSGTAGVVFSQTFTQSGGNGTITWSETGALPSGILLNSSTGTLAGTTNQTGSFPITVKATDANGCFGTSSYTLTINCQTITVTNPATNTTQAGVAFDQAFTASGILGTATWSETGALPSGITLNTSTGHLAGTTTAIGSYPITVTATDTNGCFGTGATYTLTVTCPTITVTRTGGGSFPAGVFNTAYTGQSVTASPASTYTFNVTSGALPTGLSLSSAGAISGTPSATGNFTFTVTATDTVSLCTGSQSFSIAIAPAAVADSYGAANNIIDNVQFVITGGTTASPATPFVGATGNILTNDLPSGGVTATPGTFATTGGGSVTIAADGTFIYTPGVHAAAITSDTFTYTAVSNGVTSAPATVTLTLANRVWFVKNNGGAGDGRSHLPFNTLAAAQTASAAGDIIYVYNGNNTTSGQNAGITLKANQQLIGEGVALVVNTVTLNAAGSAPTITNTAATSDIVTLHDGNAVKGLIISGATRDGISGTSHAGFTADTVTTTASTGSGVHLTSMTGTLAMSNVTTTSNLASGIDVTNGNATITLTNATINGNNVAGVKLTNVAGSVALTNAAFNGNTTGLDIDNGTATITVDSTNSILSGNSGQRTVSIQNRPLAAGNITIGAGITDVGLGIRVNNNLSGTIAFTGTQTLNTGSNNAVALTTNTGATITFSGTLAIGNITPVTGSGFVATGGGTLNVTGTANIATGTAAPSALNIANMTLTASNVTFNSVSSSGATTAINLDTLTGGTVIINGGTISNGTTGVSLKGASTNLTLAGVTISGPATGITNTTNFGTLSIGASVNVSGTTALNLTTGNLNGTFANLSSTGGTNGVLLTSIGGTGWTATAGSLVGSSGAAFKVDGGNAAMTYGGSINSSGFLVDIGATAGRTGGTITFSGALGATASGTGIRIQNSTGAAAATFTFSGSQTLGTSGSRMATTAVTLAGNNANTVFNFNGTMSIFTGAVTAFSATAGGTINFSGTDSIDSSASALSLTGVALGAGTLSNLTSAAGVNGVALTTVTGGTLTISAGSISGATGAAFLVSGGSVSVTDNGTISQATASQPLVSVAAGHTGTLTFGGNVTATNGTGLQFDNADGTYNFNGGTNSLNGGDAGIDITNGSAGTFSFSSGTSITNPTGIAYNEDTSTATVTFGGPITKNNNANNAVNINAKTGGSTTFNGAITGSTSTTNAIDLTGNTGSTVAFAGALTLTTSSGTAFNATGGGVVNVTNAGNTITVAAGGTGINWNGVTGTSTETWSTITGSGSGIGLTVASSGATNFTVGTVTTATGTAVSINTGTGDFVFTKISSNGAAKGITVTALTGGGSFTVNGTGGLCDSTHISGTDCTGGSILGGTTRGGEFNNVASLTLNNMYFKGNGTTAVACGDDVTGGTNTTCNANLYLVSVTAPSLTKIYVDGTGSGDTGVIGNAVSAMTVSGLEIANFTNIAKTPFNFQNLTGTTGITGLNVHNNSGIHTVMITNNTGTANVTLTSPTINNNSGTNNPDSLQVNSYTAGTTLNVTATNVNITASSANTGNGVMFQANTGSTMTSILNGGIVTGTNGLLMQETGTNTTYTFTVTGLTSVTTHNLGSNAITVGKANGTNATFNGTVTNNVITSALCGGGCAGIKVGSFGVSGASTVNVSNNDISGVDAQGIWIVGGQGGSSLTMTVHGNNVHNPALTAGVNTSYGIDIYPGTQSGDAVCFAGDIGDMTAAHTVPANRNTITGAWQSGGNPMEVLIFNSSTFKLLNYPNSNTNDANAAAWVKASQTGYNVDAVHLGTNQFTAGASCP
ncbi:MAG: S-layer family protein [Acidobacteria bacterium]|nr:S-layer family protein [Acidobacteriota bacterium]